MTFSEAKIEFDKKFGKQKNIPKSFITIDGKFLENITTVPTLN